MYPGIPRTFQLVPVALKYMIVLFVSSRAGFLETPHNTRLQNF